MCILHAGDYGALYIIDSRWALTTGKFEKGLATWMKEMVLKEVRGSQGGFNQLQLSGCCFQASGFLQIPSDSRVLLRVSRSQNVDLECGVPTRSERAGSRRGTAVVEQL